MASPNRTDSPASKAFADKLAKYAYDPSSSGSPRKSLRLHVAGPSVVASPVQARKGSRRDTVTAPEATKSSAKGQVGAETETDEEEEEEEYNPSPSRKRKSTKTTPIKNVKKPRPFAAPEVYAHLRPVTDHLKPDLNIIFCGINPGKMSSTLGHHFAHSTNKFWKAVHRSGITDRQIPPTEDYLMPDKYRFGLTNLCGRPTSEQSELSTLEMRLNVHDLTVKLVKNRANVVCFVGKKIWDVYESVVSKTAGEAVVVPLAPRPMVSAKAEGPDVDDFEGLIKLEREDEEGDTVHPNLTGLATNAEQDAKPDLSSSTSFSNPLVKSEPAATTRVQPTPPLPPSTPILASKSKSTIDWTQPRPFRLPHDKGYTYFWVTPSTSGLERTPLEQQVEIFRRLKDFSERLAQGDLGGTFRDINVDGVQDTVEKIRLAAVQKGKKAGQA